MTPGEDPRVSAEEVAVLGRARWHLDEVIATLQEAGVPVSVQVAGSGLFGSPAGRLAVDGLAVVANERDRPAIRRMTEELAGLGIDELGNDGPLDVLATSGAPELQRLGECLAGVAAGTIDGVAEVAEALRHGTLSGGDGDRLAELLGEYELETPPRYRELVGFVRYLQRRQQTRPSDPGVRALTVHGAKGLEFKAVVVVAAFEGSFPDYRAQDSSAVHDERRAFYVAMTRAARALLTYLAGATHTAIPSLDPSPQPSLDGRVSELRAKARLIDGNAFQASLAETTATKDDLEARQAIGKQRAAIKAEINRLARRAKLEAAKRLTDTTGITRKSTELTDAHVTSLVRDRFARESDRLRLERIELKKTGGQKGKFRHRPSLLGAKTPTPSRRSLATASRRPLVWRAISRRRILTTASRRSCSMIR